MKKFRFLLIATMLVGVYLISSGAVYAEENECYSQGYWKRRLTRNDITLANHDNETLLAYLNTPAKGDAGVILSYQFIAAALNNETHSCTMTKTVQDTFDSAYSFYHGSVDCSRKVLLGWKDILEYWNTNERATLQTVVYDGTCSEFGTHVEETLTLTFSNDVFFDGLDQEDAEIKVFFQNANRLGFNPNYMEYTIDENQVVITSQREFGDPRPEIGDYAIEIEGLVDLIGNPVVVDSVEVTEGNVETDLLSCDASEFPIWISSRVANEEFDQYSSYENLVLADDAWCIPYGWCVAPNEDLGYQGTTGVVFYKKVSDTFEGAVVLSNTVTPPTPQPLQIKLEGLGSWSSDWQSNEYLGLIGRWWDNDTNANISDAQYLAVKDEHNVLGYVVFDGFDTNTTTKEFSLDSSYHTLWTPQSGRPAPGSVDMDSGDYKAMFALTENAKWWRGVFLSENPLEFTIE